MALPATEVLGLCHFDPQTEVPALAWVERCVRACYECLLSYSNQLNHRFLDRRLVRDYRRQLHDSQLVRSAPVRRCDEQ